MRNLHKIQVGRGVNDPGIPEVPRVVFEELLVNALIHRDFRAGISKFLNPILASYVAKGVVLAWPRFRHSAHPAELAGDRLDRRPRP